MNKFFFRHLLLWWLLLLLSPLFSYAQTTKNLWVGESFRCDVTSAILGLTSDMSWDTSGGYISLTGAGAYKDVKATQYWSGTAMVKCTWKYRLYSGDKWTTTSRTWYFTCKDNPIYIAPEELELNVGERYHLTYGLKYNNSYTSSANAYFSCSSNSVSVTTDGYVTALQPGTAYVNVYSKISSNTPYCKVIVKKPIDVESATIESVIHVDADASKNLSVIAYPNGATMNSINWKIEEGAENISLSSSGRLVGEKPGIAKIYCIVNNNIRTNTATVYVSEPSLSLVSTAPSANSIGVSAYNPVTITFSHNILAGDNFSKISMKDVDKSEYLAGKVSIEDKKVVFSSTEALPPQANLILRIPSNAIKNKWGTHYSDDINIPFKTGDWMSTTLSISPSNSELLPAGTKIILTSNPDDALIFYTLDGSEPTSSSFIYSEPIIANHSMTIKAKATKKGYLDSETIVHTYNITSLAAKQESFFSDRNNMCKHMIPSIRFNSEIIKGDSVNYVELKRNGIAINGEVIIGDSILFYVPDKKLEAGQYVLNIPQAAIKNSENEYNKPITNLFYIHEPYFISDHIIKKANGELYSWTGYHEDELYHFTDDTFKNIYETAIQSKGKYILTSDGTLWEGKYDNGVVKEPFERVMDNVAYLADEIRAGVTAEWKPLIIKSDKTLWTWGESEELFGQGTMACYRKIMDDIVFAHGGVFAIDSNNKLWGMGDNYFRQLLNGTNKSSSIPVRIMSDVKFAQKDRVSLAIKKDGSLWTWGMAGTTQNGDIKLRLTPMKQFENAITATYNGDWFITAIKNDNTAWTWSVIDNYYQNAKKIGDDIIAIASPDICLMLNSSGQLFKVKNNETTKTEIMSGITSLPEIKEIKLNKTEIELGIKKQWVLQPFCFPQGSDYDTVEWTSNNETVATVTQRGIVTGVTPGQATISVRLTSKEGKEFSDKCIVTVTDTNPMIGDINGNSQIDIGDAVSVVNYLVGKSSTSFDERAADINKNGQIDIGDAVSIINYLVGKSSNLSHDARKY